MVIRALAFLLTALTACAADLSDWPFWSGYMSFGPDWSTERGSITYVQGSFTVPRLTTAGKPILIWVGMDGVFNTHVQQVGVQCSFDGVNPQRNVVFYEFYPANGVPLAVNAYPGNKMFVQILHFGDSWLLCITNLSQRNQGWAKWFTKAGSEANTAEWIVEGFDPPNLPDFGSVTFTDCMMGLNGFIGGIGEFDWLNVPCNMSTGQTAVSVSQRSEDKTAFTINWGN